MTHRLELLRKVIDRILRQQPDPIESRCGFVHLYGVAAVCALLAQRRGLDPELCATAGMLHDIWTYKTGEIKKHAKFGAQEAEKILRELGHYTDEEISAITTAILYHRKKKLLHNDMCELLKDADVLQHHLYNPSFPASDKHEIRLERLRKELGIE